ncbi:MAG: GNAT family N-acetyltransferase [Oscillospiraceae bacterium]|nr:GNAT family N-acetyltransferase [Oscillospiraceae bacterium]
MPETKDLILRKAVLEDWKAMYRNIWSQPESAKYMVWDVTESEEAAVSRMERTIAFQAAHDYHWTVEEKASGQAIGWAGMAEQSPGVWGETGIALGPAFTGKGYGKQILNLLTDYARDRLGAKKFVACCRRENLISKKLQISCGFTYTHSEEVFHPRDKIPYILDHYRKCL